MRHPDTIKYPDAFNRNQAAGFDGLFNWKWTEGCFGFTKITPMDFDGVVERRKHYLVFETKDPGVEIPQGQLITLEGLMAPRSFCVMKIWGKEEPEYFEASFGLVGEKVYEEKGEGIEKAKIYVERWFGWANNH